jgi:hypothetical protein
MRLPLHTHTHSSPDALGEEDVITLRPEVRRLYREALRGGAAPLRKCRLVFVGEGRAGKTTLVRVCTCVRVCVPAWARVLVCWRAFLLIWYLCCAVEGDIQAAHVAGGEIHRGLRRLGARLAQVR